MLHRELPQLRAARAELSYSQGAGETRGLLPGGFPAGCSAGTSRIASLCACLFRYFWHGSRPAPAAAGAAAVAGGARRCLAGDPRGMRGCGRGTAGALRAAPCPVPVGSHMPGGSSKSCLLETGPFSAVTFAGREPAPPFVVAGVGSDGLCPPLGSDCREFRRVLNLLRLCIHKGNDDKGTQSTSIL